jgi:hypothetical protein
MFFRCRGDSRTRRLSYFKVGVEGEESCATSNEGAEGSIGGGISDDGIEESIGGVAIFFLEVLSLGGEGGKSMW